MAHISRRATLRVWLQERDARRVASAEKALHANHPDIRVGDDVFALKVAAARRSWSGLH